MKKLYTLALAALVAAGASAQNYKLLQGEDQTEITEAVTDLTVGYVRDVPFPDLMPDYVSYLWDAELFVAASSSTTLTVSACVTEGDGSHVQFCGFGNCQMIGSDVITKTGKVTEDWVAQSMQLDMNQAYYSGDQGATWANPPVKGTFTIRSNDSDLKTVNFTFVNESAGVEGVNADHHSAPTAIYNLQGVKMTPGELTPGTYIFTNGKTSTKVLVK